MFKLSKTWKKKFKLVGTTKNKTFLSMISILCWLNYFKPMFHFYTLWKRQKISGFLTFWEV